MNYVTIDPSRIATYLGVTLPNAKVSQLVEYAWAFLEGETKRVFREAVYGIVEELPGSGAAKLWLREVPLETSDVEVVVEESRDGGATYSTISRDHYAIRGRALQLTGGRQWYRHADYRVTYGTGYTEAPEDIEQAVLDITRWMLAELERDPMLQSENLGDYSYTLIGPMTRAGERPFSSGTNRTINRWRDRA